jgi:hypothetical protein
MGTRLFGLAMSAADSQSAYMAENWRILHSLNFYRLGIALAAAALAFSGEIIPPFGAVSPQLFKAAGLVYVGIALLSLPSTGAGPALRLKPPSWRLPISSCSLS